MASTSAASSAARCSEMPRSFWIFSSSEALCSILFCSTWGTTIRPPSCAWLLITAKINADSAALERQIYPALSIVGDTAEHVIIDTSTAARWEKGAHEAFDREIVPVFNKWVGLPGFAAIIDAKTKTVLGCVNGNFQAYEMAEEIKKMSARVKGTAYMSRAAFSGKSTQCPPAFNTPPK